MATYRKALVWLRNNLRLQHNQSIAEACKKSEQLAFIFCLPSTEAKTHHFGFPLNGSVKYRFLLESVIDLKEQLEANGHSLTICAEKPTEILPKLMAQYGFEALFTQHIDAHNELEEINQLKKNLAQALLLSADNHLYEPNELPFALERLPDVFTQFRNKVEAYPFKPISNFTPPLQLCGSIKLESKPIPELPKQAHPWMKGGERAALKHLENYLQNGAVRHYKETRNGMLKKEDSSKLSPWLALGCLNAHTIMLALRKHEAEFGANESTYWLWFELLWRDYFRLISARYGKRIFLKGGIKGKAHFKKTPPKFIQHLQEGTTGQPFIDANLIELKQTGWMSNRGRQNVASFWIHDLGLDWRIAAEWFESQLIDYDVHSNYGNWIYLAGVGNDPRPNRKFNIQKQAEQYDANGEYVQTWLK